VPFFETIIAQALPDEAPKQRGRPLELSWPHLWFGLLLGILQGICSLQGMQRLLAEGPLGPFTAVTVTDDAIVKRLKQAGLQPLQTMLTQISQVLAHLIQPLFPADLAAFATAILALDETTWDAVQRHLPALRALPKGASQLLAGKLAGRFDIRTQQWEFVQWRDNPVGNCKLDLRSLLVGVLPGSLLLIDLGYFSIPFFDYLTQMQLWFVSRLREKVCYQIAHAFYDHDGTLDALVWLGSSGRNSPHAGHLVRLVRFWQGSHLRTYLTNQLDPLALPLVDIARLYARRWDIELAFLTLKAHLGLHHWWSGQDLLRQQQAWLVLIASQLLQALRMLLALEADCDPFEVSLPLLVQYLPKLIHQHQHPIVWVNEHGPTLGFFRPSSRCVVSAPQISLAAYTFPPPDLPLTRLACYRVYKDRPNRPPPKTPRHKAGRERNCPDHPATN
jgi:hypothetical protein